MQQTSHSEVRTRAYAVTPTSRKIRVEHESGRVFRGPQIQPLHLHFSQVGSSEADAVPDFTHRQDQKQIDLPNHSWRVYTLHNTNARFPNPDSLVLLDLFFSTFYSLENSVGGPG